MTTSSTAASGFTLIELLVVIGILALLIVAFTPSIWPAVTQSEIHDTQARIRQIKTGIDAYARRSGDLPPDNLEDPNNELQFKPDNGINTGIESLVVFMSQKRGRRRWRVVVNGPEGVAA